MSSSLKWSIAILVLFLPISTFAATGSVSLSGNSTSTVAITGTENYTSPVFCSLRGPDNPYIGIGSTQVVPPPFPFLLGSFGPPWTNGEYFVWCDGSATYATSSRDEASFFVSNGQVIDATSNGTRIIDSIPTDQSVVATTTNTVGGTIYINNEQWIQAVQQNSGNWSLKITMRKFLTSFESTSTCAQGNLGCLVPTTQVSQPPITYVFPINDTGFLSFSTTTDTSVEGTYQLNMQIVQNNTGFLATVLPWFGFDTTVLAAKAATFYVSNHPVTSTTTFGSITQPATTTDDIIASALALANKRLLDRCSNWVSFDIADCLNALMIPRSQDFGPVMDVFADTNAGLFTYAPWGYVTRIVNIFNSNATSSFPVFAAYMPDPITHGPMWFHLDINEMFAGAAAEMDTIRDPVTGDNPRDGMEQIVRSILALAVISFIFYDLVGGKKSSAKHHIGKKTKLS